MTALTGLLIFAAGLAIGFAGGAVCGYALWVFRPIAASSPRDEDAEPGAKP